jgi:cation:H+ antiporter
MDTLIIILQLVGGAVGLHFGADWLVSGSSRLALSFGVKPLIIGLTLVAFGTSAPELTVSLASALQGSADLSVGNVIGSNIANIGLILGLCALIKPIRVDAEVFRRDLPAMLFAALLIAVLPFIGGPVESGDGAGFMLDRWKGVVLLASVGFILFRMFRGAKSEGGEPPPPMALSRRAALGLLSVTGLAALLIGGTLFVDGSVSVAKLFGVPELVIGLTVLAVGTSLPELAASVMSALKGHHDMAIGNIIGSNIFNLLTVMALPGIIHSTSMENAVFSRDFFAMAAITGLLAAAIVVDFKVRRLHTATNDTAHLGRIIGCALLASYVGYYYWLFV